MKANYKVWDFELTASEMAQFDELNVGWRHLIWAEASDKGPKLISKFVLAHVKENCLFSEFGRRDRESLSKKFLESQWF